MWDLSLIMLDSDESHIFDKQVSIIVLSLVVLLLNWHLIVSLFMITMGSMLVLLSGVTFTGCFVYVTQ